MSIDELIKENTMHDVVNSLEDIDKKLKNVLKPLKKLLTHDKGSEKKEELYKRVRELRLEADALVKKMHDEEHRADLNVLKNITNKVKNIIKEKQRIQEEIKLMKVNK